MEKEDEVSSTSSICSNDGTLYLNDDPMDSVIELMKGFKLFKATQVSLQEETNRLLTERKYIMQVLLNNEHMLLKLSQYEIKNIQLREEFKLREAREHNMREVIPCSLIPPK